MRTPAVVLAVLITTAAYGGESCPLGGASAIAPNPERLYRQLSASAEAIAPTATATSRRRVGSPTVSISLPVTNYVDSQILAKLIEQKVPPTSLSTDSEFLRRVTLDLTGAIPDAAAVQAFAADTTANKRARKIDELIATDAFADRWTMWLGDLVQNVQNANNSREYYEGRNAYYVWMRDSIRASKPYDQMVREIITGAGDSFVIGTSNFVVRQLQRNGPPQDTYDNLAASSGEKFLGMPLLCTSCHNGARHLEAVNGYLATKKRSEFWQMAAFFSRVGARAEVADPNNPNIRKFQVSDNLTGRYNLNTTDGNKSPRAPATGDVAYVMPAFLLTGEQPKGTESYRQGYARMLTADRQFARNTVNLLWKEMFGLGLVEPVNAFDLSKLDTQPSHPALLEALTSDFIASGYSMRALLKTIANSTTYQLSARYTAGEWNEAWVPLYARHYPRRLPAEMVLDAVAKATSVPVSINVQGIGAVNRAMLLPDPLEGQRVFGTFLNEFGRGDRDDTMRTSDSSITQALEMMNDTIVTSRVKRSTANSTVAKVLASSTDPAVIADQLYLATLSRLPSSEEKAAALAYLRSGTLAQKSEDLQFVLLNSLEFLFY
jgi:hypothetical protein